MAVPGAAQQLFIGAQVDDSALGGLQNSIGGVADNMMLMQKAGFAAAVSIGSMLTAIGGGLTAVLGTTVATFGQLQKQMRQVQRIAGITSSKLDELRGRFIEVSGALPISAQRMASVATNASRLGIKGTEELTKFTKSMIEMGNTTTLTAEQATDSIGRMIRQYGRGFDEANKFASAMAKLSTETTATSSKLAKFGERVGATASRFGVSAGEMLAFGAAADEAGLGARTAGTQFTKLLNRFSQNADTIENMVPGINNMEKAINNNLTPAIVKFFGHLSTLENSKAQEQLNELNLASQRIIPFISTLTKNHGRLSELLGKSNEAFKEGTFISEQYQTAINNVVDDARTLVGTFGNIAKVIGGTLAPIARVILQSINALGQAFLQLPSFVQGAVGLFIGLVGIVTLLAGVIMTFVGVIGIATIGLKGLATALMGQGAVISDLIPWVVKATGAIKAFNASLLQSFSIQTGQAMKGLQSLAQKFMYLGNATNITPLRKFGHWIAFNKQNIARVTSRIGILAARVGRELSTAFSESIPLLTSFAKNIYNLDFNSAINNIKSLSSVWTDAMNNMASTATNVLNNVVGTSFDSLSHAMTGFGQKAQQVSTSFLGEGFTNAVVGGLGKLKGLFSSMLSFIPFVGSTLAGSLLPVIGVVMAVAGILFLFKDIFMEVFNVLIGMISFVGDMFTALKDGLTAGFMTFLDPLINSIELLFNTILRLFSVLTGGEGDGPSGFLTFLETVGQVVGFLMGSVFTPFIALFNTLTGILEGLIIAVRSFMQPIVASFEPLFNAFSKLGIAISNLMSSFNEMFGGAKEQAGLLNVIALGLTKTFRAIGKAVAFILTPIEWLAELILMIAEGINTIASYFGGVAEGINQTNQRMSQSRAFEHRNDVRGLATGGIVTQQTPAVVAENGPEAVLPLDKLDSILNQGGSGKIEIENHVSLDGRTVSKSVNEVDEEDNTRQYSRPEMGVVG